MVEEWVSFIVSVLRLQLCRLACWGSVGSARLCNKCLVDIYIGFIAYSRSQVKVEVTQVEEIQVQGDVLVEDENVILR